MTAPYTTPVDLTVHCRIGRLSCRVVRALVATLQVSGVR